MMKQPTYIPFPEYYDAMRRLSQGEALNQVIDKESPIDARDAAILALRFEARLQRKALRNLLVCQYDSRSKTLRTEGLGAIELSDLAAAALSRWLRCLNETEGFLFRHIRYAVEITGAPLSAQNIHYLLKKHNVYKQELLIPESIKPPSILALFSKTTSLPEAGYTPVNLRHLRESYRLTHQDVANLLGVSLRAAESWEIESDEMTAKRNMSLADWTRLISIVFDKNE